MSGSVLLRLCLARGNTPQAPPCSLVLLILPEDASAADVATFTRAAAWLAEGLALVTPTPSDPVPGPPPAAAFRSRSHQCQPCGPKAEAEDVF